MAMGIVGILLTIVGGMLLAAGWFYFELSLWALIPGGVLILIGPSLISGFLEQVRLQAVRPASNSRDSSSKDRGNSTP